MTNKDVIRQMNRELYKHLITDNGKYRVTATYRGAYFKGWFRVENGIVTKTHSRLMKYLNWRVESVLSHCIGSRRSRVEIVDEKL